MQLKELRNYIQTTLCVPFQQNINAEQQASLMQVVEKHRKQVGNFTKSTLAFHL